MNPLGTVWVPALDLGPGDGFTAPIASRLDRSRVCELLQVRFDRSSQERGFRLAGAPGFSRQCSVNLGG